MNITFSIHDFVTLTVVFAVINREEDDMLIDSFEFQDICFKEDIKETELNLLGQACDRARKQNYNFEYDVITATRSVFSL